MNQFSNCFTFSHTSSSSQSVALQERADNASLPVLIAVKPLPAITFNHYAVIYPNNKLANAPSHHPPFPPLPRQSPPYNLPTPAPPHHALAVVFPADANFLNPNW